MGSSRALVIAFVVTGALLCTERASACSCARGTVEGALEAAALVAEIQVIEVGPPRDPDADPTSQPIRARVVRVFSTETAIADGDEIVFDHHTCNSMPHGPSSVGDRYVAFLARRRARLTQHFCSFSLSASEPLPHLLLQARRRWLARR
ncbi:hypothetical protein [Sandaracinus amylolyticus]|uniref:Uncharacterized protein n=1 Tax=Sandaracinus amylolyticus TaxID=927083 RepID=A0A0F6YHN8_9BACT|nr:hypothetical protein [Sandaracinus amylolyticus]AKF05913.1 hypothetical protein DB32_003062 [Sandaracinus amylolyticus]